MIKKNKKAQEEMVGFVLIVVLVTVILVILLGIMLFKAKNVGQVPSYKVQSFIYSILSYSSDCSTNRQNHLPVQKLIGECLENGGCLDGKDSCAVLNETVSNLVRESWKTENRPVLGYKFTIAGEGIDPFEFSGGNITSRNSMLGTQNLQIGTRDVLIKLEIWG